MKKTFAYLLIIPIAILVFLLVVWIVLFSGRPKVTVNYFAEYNKISKPDGFDPNDNADEFYKEAGKAYVPPSEWAKDAMNREVHELNDVDKTSLKRMDSPKLPLLEISGRRK